MAIGRDLQLRIGFSRVLGLIRSALVVSVALFPMGLRLLAVLTVLQLIGVASAIVTTVTAEISIPAGRGVLGGEGTVTLRPAIGAAWGGST